MAIKIIRVVTVPQSLVFCRGIMGKLSFRYEMVALSSPGEALDQFCREENVKGIAVKMSRQISVFQDIKSLFELIKVFRKERPTMVHSMTPKAGMLCMVAAWLTHVPVRVHTFTGLVFPTAKGFKRKILMMTDWITCACATHIVPEGEGVKRDLINYNITKKDIQVLGYGNVLGIDLDRFDRTQDVLDIANQIRDNNAFTFIAIGRLVGDKGINELVEAFKQLHSNIPNTKLILVGDYEPELDPLKPNTIFEINGNEAIEAVGWQKDVRPWMAASDCAVLASYREGFPNVVIEAGAMGLPQIVTDVNGANEIIIDGVNGVIIPSKDSDALFKAMTRIVEDSKWQKQLASKARAMIASRYEQSYVRQCLFQFYSDILESSCRE